MNSTTFSLVILAAGYLLARRSLVWRPHVFRSEGHALYFLVVIAALAMAAFSAIALHELYLIPVAGSFLRSCTDRLLQAFGADKTIWSLGAVAIASVPLAIAFAWALNLPLGLCRSLRVSLLMRLSCLSELEEFLWATTARQLPVMLTMASSKVYVGYAIDTSTSRGEREWVRIEPFLSGYRDEKQTFEQVTDYTWLHAGSSEPGQPPIEDFDILLPADEIRSVHAFDFPTYLKKFKESETFEGPLLPPRDRKEGSMRPTKAEYFYAAYAILTFLMPFASLFLGAWGLAAWVVMIFLFGGAAALDEEATAA